MAGESKGSFFEGTPGNRSSGDGVGPVAQRIRARGYEPRCRGYANIRGQILLMQPLPPIVKAYKMVSQEEKQREGLIPKPPASVIFSTFLNNQRYNLNNFRGNRPTSQGNHLKEGTTKVKNLRERVYSEKVLFVEIVAKRDTLKNNVTKLLDIQLVTP
ncbi:hypothetical protein Tco_0682320 [Tanacetum coccineum]|uniref:Uncharacterized protein n=1 Tax=Tanacetum coccineum TaxID=301880 RepID=A0ABQ4XQU0_9ASTR